MNKLTSTLAAILISLSLLSYNPTVSSAAPIIDPVVSLGLTSPQTPKGDIPVPPSSPVKLIFIHHSTGGNWLAAPESNGIGGDLGEALMNNNYYVSATNYGWGPDAIGDRTDIGHWWDWFRGTSSATYTAALYTEYDQNIGSFGDWPQLASDPGGENEIILFKSCYPNSNLGGDPDDPATVGDNPMRGAWAGDSSYTVANAKGIYNDLLVYFATRQDKLFIVVTAPPLASGVTNATQAANARGLNNWLVNDWLDSYPYNNVAVFDFYNVLTSNGGSPEISDVNSETGNHHRWWNGAVQHLQTVSNNYSSYPLSSGDSHPNDLGNLKATAEFVQLLNVYYHRWAEPTTTYTLTVSTDGNGSVTLNPTGNSYPAGTVVRLTPVPDTGFQFATWSDANSSEPVNNGDGSWSITMNANKALTANFTLIPNVAPIITGQASFATNEDTPLTITLNDLLVTDPDDIYPTNFSLVVAPGTNYTVVNNILTPAANFNGTLTVPLTVNDGTDNSASYSGVVQVLAINDAPICSGLTLTTQQNTTVEAAPVCSDVENANLTYNIVSAATHGTASVSSNLLRYVPSTGYVGGDTFTYRAWDGGLYSAPATVTVTVIAAVTQSIDLVAGWNLISFNLHPISTSVADVLQSVSGNYDLVYAWIANASSNNWLRADNIPVSTDTLLTMDETQGFWIHMLAADTLTITGSIPTTTSIPLITTSGWNLVGYPSATSRALPDALSANGLGTSNFMIFSYHAGDISDPWKMYDRAIPPFANDLLLMTPGWGYWIQVPALASWNVAY